jgi:hypothetical protein
MGEGEQEGEQFLSPFSHHWEKGLGDEGKIHACSTLAIYTFFTIVDTNSGDAHPVKQFWVFI